MSALTDSGYDLPHAGRSAGATRRRILRCVIIALGVAFLVAIASSGDVRAQGIAVDNSSSAAGPASDVNSLTWSHTVGSGSNRILIVGVSLLRSDVTVNSITYGGTALTRIGFHNDSGSKVRVEIWKLVAPAVGTASIVVNLSATKRIVAGAVSFRGVNQTTPNGSLVSSDGTNSPASVSVSSAAGELVIDTLAVQADANSATAAAGQTQRWNTHTGSLGDGNEVIGAGSTKSGASSVTMSWALGNGKNWSLGAVALKPSPPSVILAKSVSPNGSQTPGTDLAYTITFTNSGDSSGSSLIITDAIPANTDFKVGSVVNNLGSTGLTVTVAYSNNGGSTWTYTPTSGAGGAASGYDRTVTHIRWTFTGSLSQTAPNNTGNVQFTVQIR